MLKTDRRRSSCFCLQFWGRGIFIEDHLAVTTVLGVSLNVNLPEAQSLRTDMIMLLQSCGDLGILTRKQPLKGEVEPGGGFYNSTAIEDASVEVAQRINLKDRLGRIKFFSPGSELFPEFNQQLQVRRFAAEAFLTH